jgi:hypothetical protein
MKTCIHCTEPANNGTMTLCNKHVNELRELTNLKCRTILAINKLSNKYYIEDGDIGIDYQDSGQWRSYHIVNAIGDTEEEFLANVNISEIDQDGGELNTYGFDDALGDVQNAILKRAGINEKT